MVDYKKEKFSKDFIEKCSKLTKDSFTLDDDLSHIVVQLDKHTNLSYSETSKEYVKFKNLINELHGEDFLDNIVDDLHWDSVDKKEADEVYGTDADLIDDMAKDDKGMYEQYRQDDLELH